MKFFIFIITFLFLVAIFSAQDFWSGIPTVRISGETGRCISVDNASSAYSCNRLPEEYYLEIVDR